MDLTFISSYSGVHEVEWYVCRWKICEIVIELENWFIENFTGIETKFNLFVADDMFVFIQ